MKSQFTAKEHIAPIDGLRALAVIAVLLFHLGLTWIPGGFLGVDLFFAISGYVITRLILDSIETRNALDLRQFYLARVRRLFPALLFLALGSTLFIAALAPDAIHRFLSDLPYVFTGTNNWRLVALHQDYFQAVGRPPLLQHTWSLAVEAQFYLIWPIILYLIWRYLGKSRIAPVALAISFISGAALFIFSVNSDKASAGSISHVYFGSDTHSLGLFLGSALAESWIPRNLSPQISQRAQDFIDGIGLIGLAGLILLFFVVTESNATLYRIAFPLAAVFACATLTSIVHPASRIAHFFRNRLLLWIGQRSYGIYLWHWVIFQISRPGVDLASSSLLALNLARVLLVFALSDISMRYIEIPFRRGIIQNWLRGMKYRAVAIRKNQRIFLVITSLLILTISGSATATALYRDARAPKILKEEITTSSAQPNQRLKGIWLTGDSIILGSKIKLSQQYPLALINARVGRQIQELTDVVKADISQVSTNTVVLDLGNNNHLTRESVVTLLDLLKNQPHIILVNTAVPRVWKDDNNQIIAEESAKYPNLVLVDWNAISANHPEFFTPDGVHLNDKGSDVYVAAIVDALKSVGVTE